MRASSAPVRAAHSGAPRSSKPVSAAPNDSRAARLPLALRRADPRQSSVRARSNGNGAPSSSANDASNAANASSRSSSAKASRPRPRATEPAPRGRSADAQTFPGGQVRSCLIELAAGDQRLDRVRPHRVRRLVQRPAPQLIGDAGELGLGRFEIAEGVLEPAERAAAEPDERLALESFGEGKSVVRRRSSLLDQADPSRSAPSPARPTLDRRDRQIARLPCNKRRQAPARAPSGRRAIRASRARRRRADASSSPRSRATSSSSSRIARAPSTSPCRHRRRASVNLGL